MDYQAEKWPLAAGDLADWTVDRNANIATGRCPACGHTTTYPFQPDAVAQGSTTAAPDGASREIHCACGQDHPAQPAPQPKCGRYWFARILPEGQHPELIPETDPVLQAAAGLLAERAATEEPAVRAAAEKWVAGLTALLALFGISGVVFGKDVTVGLTTPGKLILIGAVIVAVVAAGLAVVLTSAAAYGWPRSHNTATRAGLLAWYAEVRSAAGRAAGHLRAGIFSALAAVVALCVALGAMWLGPKPATPMITTTLTGGATVCGTLLAISAAGTLRIRRADGEVRPVPAAEVVKIATVSKCP